MDASLFAALANPVRLDMLRILLADESADRSAARGLSITRVAEAAEVTRFAASRHLSILREAGLVEVEYVGYCALHRLRTDQFEVVEDWLSPFVDRLSR